MVPTSPGRKTDMNSRFFLPLDERPDWLSYPKDFSILLERGLEEVGIWYFLELPRIRERRKGLATRYTNRDLIPFATRDDNDDVACWDGRLGSSQVVVIHDFASPGFEEREVLPSFRSWYEFALRMSEDF